MIYIIFLLSIILYECILLKILFKLYTINKEDDENNDQPQPSEKDH